jgi:O-antigen ligase
MLLYAGLVFFAAVAALLVFTSDPLAGIVLVGCLIGIPVLFKKPFWGMLAYVFLVGFVALFNLPITGDGLKLSSVFLLAALLAYVVTFVVQRDWSLLKLPLKRPEHILLLVFYGICFLSLMNSQDVAESLRGIKQFTYCVGSYFLIMFAVRKRKDLDTMIWVALLSGLTIGFLGIWEMLYESLYKTLNYRSVFGTDLTRTIEVVSRNRINGMVADGDLHGAYMAMVFMLTLFIFFKTTNKWHKAFMALVMLVCFINIFGAAARGAVLGFLVMSLAWWIVWNGRKKFLIGVAVVGLGFLTVSVMVTATDLDIDRVYSEPEGVAADTIDLRLNNFQISMAMFMDHPVLGVGPRGFEIEYRPYSYIVTPTARKERGRPTSLTVYTEVLAEYGLLGAVTYAAFWLLIFYRLITMCRLLRGSHRSLAFSLFGAFCGYSIFMCTSGHLVDQIFWLIVSFSVVAYEILEPEFHKALPAKDQAQIVPAQAV